MMISKIISGGQTGVDRAALDVALELGIPCSGWCPKGRLAEDGRIPDCYPLQETPSTIYPQRTEWNVRDSDATLILTISRPNGGTALTIGLARRLKKPVRIVRLSERPDIKAVRSWIDAKQIQTLNVAGPRESENGGIHSKACDFLRRLFME
jgi:hypothetical protein